MENPAELCLCHKAKRPHFDFPHIAGQSVFCMAELPNCLQPEEKKQMDWREGTWTLTEDESLLWGANTDGEIVLVVRHKGEEDEVIYLSERQAENMITGLSYQLGKVRMARGSQNG